MPNEQLFLKNSAPVGKLGVIVLDSCKELGDKIDYFLTTWRRDRDTDHIDALSLPGYKRDSFLIGVTIPRFGTGEAKGMVQETIRGLDIFIILDVTNYNMTYTMYGKTNHYSPDDHFGDLKRVIGSISGKARRINVIMPYLYESRQHKRSSRESLDCAIALQELINMGVDNIITFDAHDPRVQNSIPLHGFDTVPPTYQFIKNLLRHVPDIKIDNNSLMIISPDEGGTSRAVYMAGVMGVNMGMFYKRRDYSVIENGRNPIIAHEFLGESVEGKDVVIIDDMISSGDSMLDVARELKKRKAKRIFAMATFGLFTDGFNNFDKAVEEGIIDKVLTTNLIYQSPELLSKEYYISCDMSKYVSYIIDTLNHDGSLSSLLDPYERIEKLLKRYKAGERI